MIEGAEEADSWRNFLLAGSISNSNTKTDLLAIDPKGEYIPNEVFLYLAEERSLSLYQDRRST